MLNNSFMLPIGDWSDDGHGKGFYACARTITDILKEVAKDPAKINETVISLD